MARRSGDSWRWGLGGRGPTTISVIDTPAADKPEGAVKVPFGFGPRDELHDEVAVAEARRRRALDELVEATRARNEALARRRAARRARD